MRRGITKKYYEIATYIKEEHIRRFGNQLQDATREAIRRVFTMKEDEIIAVPKEKVEEELRGSVWKIIYTDDENLHKKWVAFPKLFKRYLHYWINRKLEVIEPHELQKKEIKEPAKCLTFYLFGKIAELYGQGFFSNEVILSVLQELKENPNEIKAWIVREYERKKQELGDAIRVFLNFKHSELREWYINLPTELRRGVWIATHQKLLDRLEKIWYNILHQKNQ
jgi:hypothetical protein